MKKFTSFLTVALVMTLIGVGKANAIPLQPNYSSIDAKIIKVVTPGINQIGGTTYYNAQTSAGNIMDVSPYSLLVINSNGEILQYSDFKVSDKIVTYYKDEQPYMVLKVTNPGSSSSSSAVNSSSEVVPANYSNGWYQNEIQSQTRGQSQIETRPANNFESQPKASTGYSNEIKYSEGISSEAKTGADETTSTKSTSVWNTIMNLFR